MSVTELRQEGLGRWQVVGPLERARTAYEALRGHHRDSTGAAAHAQLCEALKAFRETMTNGEIGKELGVSAARVAQWASEAGLKPSRPGPKVKPR